MLTGGFGAPCTTIVVPIVVVPIVVSVVVSVVIPPVVAVDSIVVSVVVVVPLVAVGPPVSAGGGADGQIATSAYRASTAATASKTPKTTAARRLAFSPPGSACVVLSVACLASPGSRPGLGLELLAIGGSCYDAHLSDYCLKSGEHGKKGSMHLL
jgi:hypothetical protein